ncbi:hypothetical protein RO3G_12017 [Rhizopus delemar RA 99-880]|uniref:Uncharacterized protein n=1 Tax=Rhizopus delemar (strain RA 99-880 / ATCC MYA-4621 / FGSC 9543 / NRRL 43880) TaxID=246409 RepID=I1CFS6_RHIO9|nr:hypothetical protein RO3G_12017 [Rhizopus delemar RA 99-880]|eukprot:EIE87306.1 hypothetical protein RO3G_12017 [Rhizopus delemar RA 99-880]
MLKDEVITIGWTIFRYRINQWTWSDLPMCQPDAYALVESKDSTQQCCQGDYLKIQGFFIAVLAQRWEMRQ